MAASPQFPEASLLAQPVPGGSAVHSHQGQICRDFWFALSVPPSLADSGLTQKLSVKVATHSAWLP